MLSGSSNLKRKSFSFILHQILKLVFRFEQNFNSSFRCDASLLMADIPEDVKLEQLLELREQLREQIDQLNANSSMEVSGSMQKVSKCRYFDRCQARPIRKTEKRLSCTVNGCTNDKVARISPLGDTEDEKSEQPSCSSIMKKPDEKVLGSSILDISATNRQNLHQYPFRYRPGLSSDITGTESESKKLNSYSKINEIIPEEIPKTGTVCTTKVDNILVSFNYLFAQLNPFFLCFFGNSLVLCPWYTVQFGL